MRTARTKKRVLTAFFALLLGLPAIRALAADPCTHKRSVSGLFNIEEYDFYSGTWQYVGSQLMHVHTDLYYHYNVLVNYGPSTIVTAYCGT